MNDFHSYPTRTRDYQGHLLDSSRWDNFRPRDTDIVVATAYKSGTTWMQTIVANLIFLGEAIPAPIMELSPWIDMRLPPLDETLELVEKQRHRRAFKTHLALDGLLFYPEVKYIYVGRDLRDVFMSMWNHHRNYTDETLEQIRGFDDELGKAWPDCPDDIKAFWRDWISRGPFPWESDGYPYWSSLHHLATWWRYRHLANILFVHFNDLKADIEGEMRRVAAFLGIAVPEAAWPGLADAVSIETMRANADRILGLHEAHFKGGGKTFLHKGTNGRWREVLDDADLALYRAALEKTLNGDAAVWLEQGGPVA